MLDLNTIEQMKTALSSKGEFSAKKFSQNNFYSLLIKHQLNMIQAWNPAKSDTLTGINTSNLAEVLLKFNNIQNASMPKPTINSTQALQNYQDVSIKKNHLSLSHPDSLSELANRVARKNNVPESLFQKLIQAESAFNPDAKSSRGAMGLGQLMPATAQELGLNLKEDHSIGSVLHPESNLDASARYLRKLFDKYVKEGISSDEAWNFAAGAYNAGMGNIGRAMGKVEGETVKEWDQVAAVLPQVTGKFSSETIRYVNRLRA